jgi:hypothetical protein
MTRVLSELLGTPGPAFHLSLRQVELSAGMPNADIRLTVEVQQQMRSKLKELGLDPDDTTPEELYAALGTRLKADDARLVAAITGSGKQTDDPLEYLARKLQDQIRPKHCFALKSAVAKKLLKTNLPKKTMKLLGYRSADSMFKHESAASLTAAAWLIEPDAWNKKQLASYGKLKSGDFEIRAIAVEHPSSKRWQTLAEAVVTSKRHNIVGLKEQGTVVLLPLPKDRPDLVVLTTAVLILKDINDIHASSTYLKLHQVQPNFGTVVRQVVTGDTKLEASLFDQPVSWSLVQQYFARFRDEVRSDLFEPVIHAEDFAWHSAETVLARIEPGLAFWQGTSFLAHMRSNKIVSLNLTDALLSHCNGRDFGGRLLQNFRHELSTELSLRYMMHDRLQQAIIGQVQNQLAFEPALA